MCPPFYDAVIPHAFNPADFEFSAKKAGYLLYLGRLIKNKGVDIAIQVAQATGSRLVVAGQGTLKDLGYVGTPDGVDFVGYADIGRRKELMRDARALLLPTYYIEPFGCVVVEAQFSGTPAVTTDWGAFNETVVQGVTGFRCRTFEQFISAANLAGTLDPAKIRKWAEDNYSLDRVRRMYEEYFHMLEASKTPKGWYHVSPEGDRHEWLSRYYPQ